MSGLSLSPGAAEVIRRLERAGFEAYAVGGCVRDSLMGRLPHDFDVAASATPDEVIAIFSQKAKIITTGLKHGTVTLIINEEQIEITTFRTESAYSDFRRPDRVEFSNKIDEDLSRRDFTINAMAWSPLRGLADPFGGAGDLSDGIIRAVGDPAERFSEDPLRILRALRFASKLGFGIEPTTGGAMRAQAGLLGKIAGERVYAELRGIFAGKAAGQVLSCYLDVIDVIIPGSSEISGLPERLTRKKFCDDDEPWIQGLAVLLAGRGSKPGLAAKLGLAALDRLGGRLKLDKYTHDMLCFLIANQRRTTPPDDKYILRRLSQWGEKKLAALLTLRDDERTLAGMVRLIGSGACYSLAQLEVSGGDLIELGLSPGEGVGRALRGLLRGVTDGQLSNDRDSLLHAAGKYIANPK